MQEVFEKIKNKLTESAFIVNTKEYGNIEVAELEYIYEVVEQVAAEYNNGWIPYSERLPEKKEYLKNDGRFIVTDGNRRYQGWFDIYDGHFAKPSRDDVMKEDKCVIAWQPLPSPYKPKED